MAQTQRTTSSEARTQVLLANAQPMRLYEPLTTEDLDRIFLQAGTHDHRGFDSVCVMEAVAWFAGEPHSDHPTCVSPVIAAFLRVWNDGMNTKDRQILKPLIPRVINTAATPEIEMQRSWMVLDWYCRVSTPAWLRLAGLTTEAEAIEATASIVDSSSASAAQGALDTARSAGRKARAAAWDAAWDAARAAAGAVAGAVAGAAAGAVAGAAAWDAARDAARAVAGAAAWDAAGDELRPTVVQLQTSAIGLIERMIAVTGVKPVTVTKKPSRK